MSQRSWAPQVEPAAVDLNRLLHERTSFPCSCGIIPRNCSRQQDAAPRPLDRRLNPRCDCDGPVSRLDVGVRAKPTSFTWS